MLGSYTRLQLLHILCCSFVLCGFAVLLFFNESQAPDAPCLCFVPVILACAIGLRQDIFVPGQVLVARLCPFRFPP